MKRPLIVIEGPTAVGKSDIAVLVAGLIGGEIISADSMQVYRYMDIGSGKITREEMKGIPHYMLDVVSPCEDYDISRYAAGASEAVKSVYSHGKIPILTGGTGFYIQAVIKDIDFSRGSPVDEYRRELEELAASRGKEAVHSMLEKVDEKAASAIHPNNLKKVIRALEYYRVTGEKISERNDSDREKAGPYDCLEVFINQDRDILYGKIEKRIDKMMSEGLTDEVRRLKEMGASAGSTAMQGLGYKEILGYLNGEYSLEEAVMLLKRNTRHYAKRQVTWFRHQGDPIEIMREDHDDDNGKIARFICGLAKERFGRDIICLKDSE